MSVNEERFERLANELRGIIIDGTDAGVGDGGYSASADAIWKAALAAFEWVASEVGATGFQASWAALTFYGKAMGIDSPFMVLRLEDALYPQYDLPGKVHTFLDEQRGWLAEEAKKKLEAYEADPWVKWTDETGAEKTSPSAHPSVVAHWRSLVAAVLS